MCDHKSNRMPKWARSDGKALRDGRQHPEAPHEAMRVSWDSRAGSLGVAREISCALLSWTERELLIQGRRQRLCVSGVKGQRLCVCQGHRDRLHTLLERLILMCPALQGTKPCSMGSASQKESSTGKAGLDLASPWSSTWPVPSTLPEGGGHVDTWLFWDKRL